MQNLMEYDDYKFQSASKEDLKLGDKDAKKENKRLKVWVRWQDLALLKQVSHPKFKSRVPLSTQIACCTVCVVMTVLCIKEQPKQVAQCKVPCCVCMLCSVVWLLEQLAQCI